MEIPGRPLTVCHEPLLAAADHAVASRREANAAGFS